VTDIPGTTRDFLEETVDLDGMPVTFVDTAGLRTPEDPVEAAGVERALALAESADIVLLLSDATAGVEATLPDSLSTKDNVISLLTKADLAPGDVSAVTGVGIDTIVEIIRRRALPEGSDQGVTAVVTSARHYEALKEAVEAMERAENASMRGETPDIISVEIQESLAQLGLIVGETTSEDLLDRIFSTFCIGK
jgi:tRNA modification GTPase